MALHWLTEGYGYEITAADVWAAYANTLEVAESLGKVSEVRARIRNMVRQKPEFVGEVLGRELGLPDV